MPTFVQYEEREDEKFIPPTTSLEAGNNGRPLSSLLPSVRFSVAILGLASYQNYHLDPSAEHPEPTV